MEVIKAVVGILCHDNKILLLRRDFDDDSFPGFWCFPGGRIEDGEDTINALYREVEEETSITKDKIVKWEQFGRYFVKDAVGRDYDIEVFSSPVILPTTIKLSHEHVDARFYDEQEASEIADEIIGDVTTSAVMEFFKNNNKQE